MSITLKNNVLIPVILAVIVGIYVLGYIIGRHRGVSANTALISAYTDTLSSYRAKIHGDSVTAYQILQIVATQKQAIDAGVLEKKDLKALNLSQANEITALKGKISVLIDSIAHTGQIIHIDTVIAGNNEQKNALLLPFEFSKKDKYMNLFGSFDVSGKMDINLTLPMSVSVYSGAERKTGKPTVIVTSDNPHIGVIDVTSYKFDSPKVSKWGIGIQGGWGISFGNPVRTTPYLGVGIQRSLIRF